MDANDARLVVGTIGMVLGAAILPELWLNWARRRRRRYWRRYYGIKL